MVHNSLIVIQNSKIRSEGLRVGVLRIFLFFGGGGGGGGRGG